MAIDLFEDCDPAAADEDLSKIEINTEFARRFEHNKKRESLQKLEELKKRGLVGSSSDDSDESSSDESSSEDNSDLAASGKDLKFLDALVKVKQHDPILEQPDATLFSDDGDEEEEEIKPKRGKKERPSYLKDVIAKNLIEEGPEFGEEKPLKHSSKIYSKEQVKDIKALQEAEKEAFGSDDDGDFIKPKESRENEMDDENAVEARKKLDEYFGEDGNLSENEMFLKSFLLNKMWVDKEKDKKVISDDVGVSEDEDELDKQDDYEAKYNFRHEEMDGDRVVGHARVTEGSVRKKTSSRKVQRKSKEERMAHAEFERKEELKHLKNLKKKEIQEKLEKIRAIAGIGEDGVCKLGVDDLEEDFDPEEYDKKMKEMFDVGYYGAEDADLGFVGDEGEDLEKPDFDKEDEMLGLPKDWDVFSSKEGFLAARERVLKQKSEEEVEDVEPVKAEGKRKRKRKISLKEKVELDKELEEYYKLDYEDTIGDLKTRFKYKSVPANKYGLGVEETLMADDKDLNQYVSLKKLAPYRQDEWKVTHHQKLKKNLILQGKYGAKSGKETGLKEGLNSTETGTKGEPEQLNGEANVMSRTKRRRRRQAELKLSRSRLMAYGKIPTRPEKKH